MSGITGKKLILIGERDGVPGLAMAKVFEGGDAEVVFAATECFV